MVYLFNALRHAIAGCVVVATTMSASIGLAAPADEASGPQWIWGHADEVAAWKFSKTIELDRPVLAAGLKLAADGCQATVVINDAPTLTLEPFSPTTEFDVTRWMRRGKNTLVVVTTRAAGPPAVALSLSIAEQGDRRTSIVSDGTWSGASAEPGIIVPDVRPARALGAVRPELWGIGRRPAITSPFENYEQWKDTQSSSARKDKAPKFYAAPGFEITLVRKALPEEGSWISMAFDPQGRLTVSREDHGLLQMTLADDRKSVTKVEPVNLEVDEVRGMVYADGLLYLNANNSHTMYTAKPMPDGTFADLKVVRKFPGKVGHGRNDLALGPDGSIYSMHGDAVEQPKQNVLDRTSPLRESRKLVAAGKLERREGHLVRLSPDRKSWELVCSGLRNPYGVAVHPNGDVFTYDADNEFDMGTPWYRPTRIVQLVSGADYGYRDAGGTWPVEVPDHPDVGLPLIDVGRGSPTSAMFGHKLAFPSLYREALYVLDWSYGRVLAVHLEPRGSGYRAALELFLQGQPLNVTDIATGPDGAMYLIAGGRKTESALYRVAFTGLKAELEKTSATTDGEVHRRASELYADEQRAIRRKLDSFHGKRDPKATDAALPYFDSSDPMIRLAARIAVEHQPASQWKSSRGLPSTVRNGSLAAKHDARLDVATTLLRAGDKEAAFVSLDYVCNQVLGNGATDYAIDLSTLLIVVEICERAYALEPMAFARSKSDLVRRLADEAAEEGNVGLRVSPYGTSVDFRRRVARLIAEVGIVDDEEVTKRFVERLVTPLLASSVQEDKLAGLLALRQFPKGVSLETKRRYFETLQDASRFVGGQGMSTFIDKLRSEAKASLSDADKKWLGDVVEPPKVVDEPLPPARPLVQKWKLAELSAVHDDTSTRSAQHVGDAKRGAEIFRMALCSRCHRSGLNGPAVGPDLTVVARRFSRRDMLESILVPSLAVAEQYRNAEVTTEDGKLYTGRVVSEGDFRSAKLKLSTDPLRPSKTVELDKSEIAEYRSLTTSPMPEGLLDSFSPAEIADLLAFLESGVSQ
jgi:putative heme-binding domain-containing protein